MTPHLSLASRSGNSQVGSLPVDDAHRVEQIGRQANAVQGFWQRHRTSDHDAKLVDDKLERYQLPRM